MNWIFQNPDYCLWQNEDNVRLLWIKGGAGKGKTMMSIGLIDNFLEYDSSITTYFFCKFTDYKLNTLKAIITSLIWQLVQNQAELLNSLLNHWDPVKSRYKESFSWRALWNIFLEMLDQCRHQKVYVVVDALDECENDGMAEFLTLIVRTGLGYSNVKWLLTSRPLNSADERLLKTTQQLGVSFELNSDYLKTAIKAYVQHKVNELYPHHKHGVQRPQRVESELLNKAEGTFLWVSLVCKRLESERIPVERALKTIKHMPPGLQPLYKRVFSQVVSGDAATIKRSLLLLKVMVLAYRPLAMNELANVMGASEAEVGCEWIVDRCASFIKMRGSVVEFVHQSSRDFLAQPDLLSSYDRYKYGDIFSFYEQYGDGDVALTCLNSMRVSTKFNKNLISLPLPNSTREVTMAEMGTSNDKEPILNSMNYAAVFWAEHLQEAKDNWLTQHALRMQKEVRKFLREKLLEWLECLSLLGELPHAIRAFKVLERICEGDYFPNNRLWKRRRLLLQSYVLDANRFLLRHKQTISAWPLQIYSSTIVFSPKKSQVRSNDRHMEKIDKWLKLIPHFETNWNSSYQTLEGHTSDVEDVAFSSDGKYLASASRDQTIRLWDTATGSLQTTLEGHPGSCSMSVIFFGNHLVSASHNRTIHLWDMNPKNPQEMKFQKIKLPSTPYPEHRFKSMAFSADGKYLATIGSTGSTMETSGLLWLWNINTDDLQKSCLKTTLHPKIPGGALKLAFSPDNKFLALVSQEYAIWLLNLGTDYLHKINIQEINRTDKIFICQSLEFSPNGEYLAAAYHNKIGLWNISTGDPQKTLIGHKNSVEHVTFSSNDKYLASTSCDKKIKLWDVGTGDLKKTFEGLRTARFSPDTKCLASVSGNFTVRLWDIDLDNHQEIAEDSYMHTDLVTSVIFSPDGKYFASASSDCSVKLWDANNGNFLRTLQGHTTKILNVAFSPDGKYIASASYDGTVQLWCVDGGILKATSTDHTSAVEDVIFSPDSKCLASTSHDCTIQLWTIESGQKRTLRGHGHTVSSAAFSLNGKYIASASQDFTIKLWDANTGNHLKTLRAHNNIVLSVAFSSDSKCIASSGCDKTIRLWDVNACLQSTGLLESNFYEWHRYFRTSEKSDNVKKMKFSVGDEFIQTNLSPFQVNGTGYNCGLYLRNGWIWYGLVSVLRIPPDLETSCYDVQGNRLIIGSEKGLVLFFEFDREKLDQLSELRYGR
ncbi:WD40-repeat-containing domain protein [Talaromyces proteolyticus]|uniref:Mitochondrial division protein 1 n=1 Tax=Talaromyces proteolyticus TaxID=1131652 RepID=A0AAD4KZ91_9EURO|nr:WD40-repeat-containing domain protein [Talaromyces proteolyticus]KAH8700560.1 WD40-repeat-containing domain protein [Talaromyces proteolyticus]